MPKPKEDLVTIDYIYSLPDGKRAELIDGIVYNMSPSNTLHQKIVMQIHIQKEKYLIKAQNDKIFLYDI